jgi:hypothetical protein
MHWGRACAWNSSEEPGGGPLQGVRSGGLERFATRMHTGKELDSVLSRVHCHGRDLGWYPTCVAGSSNTKDTVMAGGTQVISWIIN